jgi:hypothetical protein
MIQINGLRPFFLAWKLSTLAFTLAQDTALPVRPSPNDLK